MAAKDMKNKIRRRKAEKQNPRAHTKRHEKTRINFVLFRAFSWIKKLKQSFKTASRLNQKRIELRNAPRGSW